MGWLSYDTLRLIALSLELLEETLVEKHTFEGESEAPSTPFLFQFLTI